MVYVCVNYGVCHRLYIKLCTTNFSLIHQLSNNICNTFEQEGWKFCMWWNAEDDFFFVVQGIDNELCSDWLAPMVLNQQPPTDFGCAWLLGYWTEHYLFVIKLTTTITMIPISILMIVPTLHVAIVAMMVVDDYDLSKIEEQEHDEQEPQHYHRQRH